MLSRPLFFLLSFVFLNSCLLCWSSNPTLLTTPSALKKGLEGPCFRPGDSNNVYVSSVFAQGIYKVNKRTGKVHGFIVSPPEASADDCAFTPDGNFIVWTEILRNRVRVKNLQTNQISTVGSLPWANGISCLNNTYCAASQYPPFRGGLLVSFNPAVPQNGLSTVYDFQANGFSTGLNGFQFRSDGTLFAPIGSGSGGGALDTVISFNVNTRAAPTVIASGFIDTEAVRLSPDNSLVYILEEARSEIYAVSLAPTTSSAAVRPKVLAGAIREPSYIDNFAVDPADGTIIISESASNSLFRLFPAPTMSGGWTLITTSQVGGPAQIQVVNQPPPLVPMTSLALQSNSPLAHIQIFIADFFSIRRLSVAGSEQIVTADEFGLDVPFGFPCLVVDSNNYYICANGGLQIRSRATGLPTVDNFAPGLGLTLGMTQLPDGKIVIADHGTPALPAVSYTGAFPFTIPGQPAVPSTISTFDNHNGSLLAQYTLPNFNSIVGVAADPNNQQIVYFTDWVSSTVGKFNTATSTVTVLANRHSLACPSAIAYSSGKVYVVDTGNNRVVAIDVSTQQLTVVATGVNVGYLEDCPTDLTVVSTVPGIDVDAQGNVYLNSDVDSAIYAL